MYHIVRCSISKHHDTIDHIPRFKRISFTSDTKIHLIDIAKHLMDFTVVDQFVQDNGTEDFNSKIEQLQGNILSACGYDPGDLLFEDVTLTKTVNFHVEIHSTD